MFIIKKIFNNNVLLAEDEQKNEFVFMGKGIGFSKSVNESVNEVAIQKKFQLETTNQAHILGKFLADLDESYFKTIKEIVDHAKEKLNITLSDYIYLSLTDHISYAIERNKEGGVFRNPIRWEIKKAYAKEYEIGKRALEIIEKNLKVALPEEEMWISSLKR
ncbi:PRD domain-containing protein [Lachnospiraceae bacterium 54-53]